MAQRATTPAMARRCTQYQQTTPMTRCRSVFTRKLPPPNYQLTGLTQWSDGRKTLILIVCSLYSFLSNSALLGPSVYIGIYSEEFGITPTAASNLVSYANLAFGFGSLLLVPAYHKFGRRPVMLGSLFVVRCSRIRPRQL